MNFCAAAPLVILAATIAVLLGLISLRRSHRLAAITAGLGLLAALASIPYAAEMAATAPALPSLFVCNLAALGFIALILLSALLILIIAASYWRRDTPVLREEYPLLLLIATLGATALAASGNFITLFLGLETMTLAMIGMIAYPRYRPEAEEAGLKYLILSGMSSAFVLFGIGVIELCTGSLDFSQILGWAPPDAPSHAMLLAGLALLGIGAAFKLSVVPFHIWVPDIYAGAPAPSGGYVAVIAKIAVLAILIRLIGQAGGRLPADITALITVIAILSMLAGNLLALRQGNIKRLLGYSSIAHLGYLLVAILACCSLGQSAAGQTAALFYLVTYSITMIAAFGAISALSHAASPRDHDTIADLRGLFWVRPAVAGVLTLALLSLAGIPPAIGFIAKMYIFAAGIHTALWNLTGVMVASSIIGLFYYLNIILIMSMHPGPQMPLQAIPFIGRITMATVSLPMLIFGIAPQPLITLLRAVFQ
jgi:NADH-quinone oxidoreductase subunit N